MAIDVSPQSRAVAIAIGNRRPKAQTKIHVVGLRNHCEKFGVSKRQFANAIQDMQRRGYLTIDSESRQIIIHKNFVDGLAEG